MNVISAIYFLMRIVANEMRELSTVAYIFLNFRNQ